MTATLQQRLRRPPPDWQSDIDTCHEAADRIDALEKALRRLDNLTAHDAAIVAGALGEGE